MAIMTDMVDTAEVSTRSLPAGPARPRRHGRDWTPLSSP